MVCGVCVGGCHPGHEILNLTRVLVVETQERLILSTDTRGILLVRLPCLYHRIQDYVRLHARDNIPV